MSFVTQHRYFFDTQPHASSIVVLSWGTLLNESKCSSIDAVNTNLWSLGNRKVRLLNDNLFPQVASHPFCLVRLFVGVLFLVPEELYQFIYFVSYSGLVVLGSEMKGLPCIIFQCWKL
jgi:hypothetical protein